MYKIYKIEDINDLCYIGKTKDTLTRRFCNHVCEQRNYYGKCSSSQLNLYNSIITEIEGGLTKAEARVRERYWIHNSDCVNKITNHCDVKLYKSKYRSQAKNKEIERKQKKNWYDKNKDKVSLQHKQSWYCECCKISITLVCKGRHLKSQKHHLNNNI